MSTDPAFILEGEAATQNDPPPTVPAPRWRAVETLSTMATRMSFLAVAWLVLAATHDWVRVGLVLTVQAGIYLVVSPLALRWSDLYDTARLVLIGQLASAVMLAVVAFCYYRGILLLIAVALVGGVRAGTDVVTNALAGAAGAVHPPADDEREAPPREWGVRAVLLVGGAVLGIVANALGAPGMLWLVAMMATVCAGMVVLDAGVRGRDLAVPDTGEGSPADQPGDRLALRLAVILVGTSLFACLAAVTLIVAWLGLDTSPRHLGLLGGAFALGVAGGAAFFTARTGHPARALMLAAGFIIGGGSVAVGQDLRPAQILVVAVAAVAGVAMSSVTPVIGVVMSPRIPAASRQRAGSFAAVLSCLGLLIGVWVAAFISVRVTVGAAVAVSAVSFLVAMLIPALWPRTWKQLTPAEVEHPPVLRRTARLAGRLSITLTYTDGQWLVEVRKGRAVLGTRHMVKSAEALNMLSLLDDPALNRTLEETVNTDQHEAVRQVDRMRTELADLEAKLSGLTEMREYGESRRLD